MLWQYRTSVYFNSTRYHDQQSLRKISSHLPSSQDHPLSTSSWTLSCTPSSSMPTPLLARLLLCLTSFLHYSWPPSRTPLLVRKDRALTQQESRHWQGCGSPDRPQLQRRHGESSSPPYSGIPRQALGGASCWARDQGLPGCVRDLDGEYAEHWLFLSCSLTLWDLIESSSQPCSYCCRF